MATHTTETATKTETAAERRARKLLNAVASMERNADSDDRAEWTRARKAAARKLYAAKTSRPITIIG